MLGHGQAMGFSGAEGPACRLQLLIVEDPDATEPNDKGQKIRPAFKLVPASAAYPPGQTSWQVLVSLVLLTLTFGSCLQFGLVAEVKRLGYCTSHHLFLD